jgi:hypothetical protein
MASRRRVQLSNAVVEMVMRYGQAERQAAHAFEAKLSGRRTGEQYERLSEASRCRFKAIQRLTAALRDLKEEK